MAQATVILEYCSPMRLAEGVDSIGFQHPNKDRALLEHSAISISLWDA